jgi:hypothetical protein
MNIAYETVDKLPPKHATMPGSGVSLCGLQMLAFDAAWQAFPQSPDRDRCVECHRLAQLALQS